MLTMIKYFFLSKFLICNVINIWTTIALLIGISLQGLQYQMRAYLSEETNNKHIHIFKYMYIPCSEYITYWGELQNFFLKKKMYFVHHSCPASL